MADRAQVKIRLESYQSKASPYSGDIKVELDIDQQLAAGTSASCFDHSHRSTRDPGATTAEDVDLRALTDAEGTTMSTLAEIVFLAFYAPSTNTARCWAISSAFFLPMARRNMSAPPSE